MGPRQHDDTFGAETIHGTSGAATIADLRISVLTIAWHPELDRVGHAACLVEQAEDGVVALSRLSPLFGPPGAEDTPLRDKHLSRTPHRLLVADDGVTIEAVAGAAALEVDGAPLVGRRFFDEAALAQGVVLTLAARVVLLLHTTRALQPAGDDLGMVGQSDAIAAVRERITRVAEHDVPVLIRGESGTGKELVARAIHRASRRRDQPFVSVNMAALVPSTAAAALFGHTKGAFTGASDASSGYFGAADGGTLFLDEIGDTPSDVQPAMLRALETGEVQPLGSGRASQRDVRLLAATDADLERAVDAGRFRLPLLQRLSGYEVSLPPLRQRRQDIPLLLLRFLREGLARAGRDDRLRGPEPWLAAPFVARALRAPWPGNVRELRNVAQKLIIDFGALDAVDGARAEAWLADPRDAKPPGATPESTRTSLRDISEDRVIEVLKRHAYQPGPTAKELGISRSSLYAIIDGSSRLRKAGALEAADIQAALDATGGDAAAAAAQLEVSERGLVLRMKQLGLR